MGVTARATEAVRTAISRWVGKGQPTLADRLEMQGLITRGSDAPLKGDAEILKAYQNSPWIRSTLGKIAQYVAAVPWYLEIPRGAGGKALRLRTLQTCSGDHTRTIRARYKQQGVTFEEVFDHPLLDLMGDANALMTGSEAREVTQLHLELTGESFWLMQLDPNLGIPIAYWPAPSTWVTRTPEPGRTGYGFSVDGMQFDVPETQVVWLRYRNPANPYGRGVGYATALGDELDSDEYAAKFIKTFFYNRATPDFMIGVENATEPQLQHTRKLFEERHRGWKSAHRPHFFSGKLTVHEMTKSFADTEIVNLRTWEREAIRSMWGVPAELMGLTQNSNRAAITTASQIMAQEVIIPRLEFMRSQLQSHVVPLFDDRYVINYVSPAPGDRDLELSYVQVAPWAATRGELRVRQGLEDRGDVDAVHMMPFGLTPLDSEKKPEATPPPPVPAAPPPSSSSPAPAASLEAPHTKAITKAANDALAKAIAERMRPEEIQAELDPLFLEQMEQWGTRVHEDLGIKPSFSMQNPAARDWLEKFSSERIVGFNETARELVRDTLAAGMTSGDSIDEMRRSLQAVFLDMSSTRAERIARTEVVGASNQATLLAHQNSGVVESRQFVATRDDRTRETHVAMDGQVVGISEPFVSPSGDSGMCPGAFGTAEENVNCRCTSVAVIGDPKDKAGLDLVWRAYDERIRPWEDLTLRGLRRAYARQQEAVTEALNDLLA